MALSLLLFAALLFSADAAEAGVEGVKLRMSFEGGKVVVSMYDTPAGRKFVSLLPLTMAFKDYAQIEKIADLPQKLTAPGGDPPAGDFAYYAPWGNLAIFYKGFGADPGLYTLGKIISGKEELAALDRDFTATIEVVR